MLTPTRMTICYFNMLELVVGNDYHVTKLKYSRPFAHPNSLGPDPFTDK